MSSSSLPQYRIVYSRRKSVGITVRPNQEVIVRAPHGVDLAVVEEVIAKHQTWIEKHQQRFAKIPPRPVLKFNNGEPHLFLGEEYPLQIVEAGHQPEQVALENGQLFIAVKKTSDTIRKKQLLAEWYRQQAKAIFAERLVICYEQARHLGIPYPKVVVREMKTRWGSCSGRVDRINLNTRLVQTPLNCVDYVILHELCHFREHNHSSRFYQLMTDVCPDWRTYRATLNDIGKRIMV